MIALPAFPQGFSWLSGSGLGQNDLILDQLPPDLLELPKILLILALAYRELAHRGLDILIEVVQLLGVALVPHHFVIYFVDGPRSNPIAMSAHLCLGKIQECQAKLGQSQLFVSVFRRCLGSPPVERRIRQRMNVLHLLLGRFRLHEVVVEILYVFLDPSLYLREEAEILPDVEEMLLPSKEVRLEEQKHLLLLVDFLLVAKAQVELLIADECSFSSLLLQRVQLLFVRLVFLPEDPLPIILNLDILAVLYCHGVL